MLSESESETDSLKSHTIPRPIPSEVSDCPPRVTTANETRPVNEKKKYFHLQALFQLKL